MAGEEVASRAAPASPLPALLDFSKYIAGSKTTGSGSSASATQGQSAPLESLIGQMADPNNLMNLVSMLFNQGAAQVPGLTTQFANATGTRVDNNSMLAQSLAQLNTNLAQQLAQHVLAQQQAAAQAAGKLAETNKTTTTNNTNKSATAPGSVGKGIGTMAGGIAAGHLINRFGDKILGGNKSSVPTATTDAPVQPIGPTIGDIPMDPNAGAPLTDLSTLVDPSENGISQGAMMTLDGIDAGNEGSGVLDAGAAGADAGAFDVGSADFSDVNFSDFGDWGFADGGVVGGKKLGMIRSTAGASPNPNPPSPARMRLEEAVMTISDHLSQKILEMRGRAAPSEPDASTGSRADAGGIDKYADGGNITPIRRNAANMGTMNSGVPMSALNLAQTGYPAGSLPAILTSAARKSSAPALRSPQDESMGGSSSDASGDAAPGGAAPAGAPGTGPGAGGVAVAAALSSVNPVAIAANMVMQTLMHTLFAPTPALNDVSEDPSVAGVSQANMMALDAIDAANESPVDTGVSVDAAPTSTSNPNDAAEGGAAAAGAAAAAADASSASPSDAGSSGGDAGGGSGDMADGGTVKAKSKRALRGIDTQPIMATPGEYMLPIDTVELIGKDILDELVGLTHISVAGR